VTSETDNEVNARVVADCVRILDRLVDMMETCPFTDEPGRVASLVGLMDRMGLTPQLCSVIGAVAINRLAGVANERR
jgi:hypothetical protein